MQALNIPLATLPAECEPLRAQVRAFLAEHMPRVPLAQRCRNWMAADPGFSRLLGQQGWLGMTWPRPSAARGAAHWNAMWCWKNCWPPARRWARTGSQSARAARC